jgi:hypothetical protein
MEMNQIIIIILLKEKDGESANICGVLGFYSSDGSI